MHCNTLQHTATQCITGGCSHSQGGSTTAMPEDHKPEKGICKNDAAAPLGQHSVCRSVHCSVCYNVCSHFKRGSLKVMQLLHLVSMHSNTHTHARAHTQTHTRAHTHTHTHTHTNTHAHAHTHTKKWLIKNMVASLVDSNIYFFFLSDLHMRMCVCASALKHYTCVHQREKNKRV